MWETLQGIMRENPMVTANITLVLTAAFSYLARDIPRRVWGFIMTQSTCHMTMDNTRQWDGVNPAMEMVQTWYLKHGLRWLSRSVRHLPDGTIVVGPGTHYFVYKRRLFWFQVLDLPSTGVHIRKQELNIVALTRNQALIEAFVEEVTFIPDGEKQEIEVYIPIDAHTAENPGGWHRMGTFPIRPDAVPLCASGLYEKIIGTIHRFEQDRDWYLRTGAPYKRTILLSGPPGTGKTSLVTQIAAITGRDIYSMEIANVHSSALSRLMGTVPSHTILLLEDIHAEQSLVLQEYKERGLVACRGALSCWLNVLSGVLPLEDIIVVLTTNYKEWLVPELYRPGRVDLDLVVDYLDTKAVLDWVARTYGQAVADGYSHRVVTPNLVSGELYRLYELHREDHAAIMEQVTRIPTLSLIAEEA